MTGFHLVTDLDGTWLAGDAPPRRRLEAFLAARPEVAFTFATGRTFAAALEALTAGGLHPPRHVISDVGAALFHRTADGGWVEDAVWAERTAAAWDAPAAAEVLAALPPSVEPQAGVAPRRRLALRRAAGAELGAAAAALAETCRACGLAADLLPSHGLYLDVLPRGVHKGSALAFLQATRGLPRPVVACGDSGNDFALLEAADLPLLMPDGVTDAELPPSLRARVRRTETAGPGGIHRALAAAGLLEGRVHGH